MTSISRAATVLVDDVLAVDRAGWAHLLPSEYLRQVGLVRSHTLSYTPFHANRLIHSHTHNLTFTRSYTPSHTPLHLYPPLTQTLHTLTNTNPRTHALCLTGRAVVVGRCDGTSQ